MRELVSAVEARKPLIAIVDPDADRGGLPLEEVRTQLIDAAESSFARWGFDEGAPSGEALFNALLSGDGRRSSNVEIEWNRIGVFQEVSLRLIAERLLSRQRRRRSSASLSEASALTRRKSAFSPSRLSSAFIGRRSSLTDLSSRDSLPRRRKESASPSRSLRTFISRHSSLQEQSRHSTAPSHSFHTALTYTQTDITRVAYILPAPRKRRRFHLYCSRQVYGSLDLVQEVQAAHNLDVHVSHELRELQECERMLVYLHKGTWRVGEASAQFAQEVATALRSGVQLLLAHEMPGADQAARSGVEFAAFFDCEQGTTPPQLIRAGIYSQIAVALKGGAHRTVSMALLAKALVEPPEDVQPVTFGSSFKIDDSASSLHMAAGADAPRNDALTTMVLNEDGLVDTIKPRTATPLQRWRRRLRPANPILSSVTNRSDDPKASRASLGQSAAV